MTASGFNNTTKTLHLSYILRQSEYHISRMTRHNVTLRRFADGRNNNSRAAWNLFGVLLLLIQSMSVVVDAFSHEKPKRLSRWPCMLGA
jgi:hypothetical protein